MNKLYFDQDGVVADFEAECRTRFEDLSDSESLSTYKARIGGNQFWRQIRATEGAFWREMPPLDPDIASIWKRAETLFPHISILSSPDDRDEYCIQGKSAWIDQHLGSRVLRLFRSDKYVYACPKSVLVDDLEKNTVPWEAAGGKSILFTHYSEDFWNELGRLSAPPQGTHEAVVRRVHDKSQTEIETA